MADKKENYWSKHHWAILQWATALYCGLFSTWEHYHPRTAQTLPHVRATTPSGGVPVTTTYTMPLWLWVGIIALVLSVVIPQILGFIRRKALPIFDAEVYRIEVGKKNPFWSQTRDFMRAINRGDEFTVGVDFLIELYVVNVSSVTQYIRDISGFVEIEGTKIPLVMQQGFDAYDLNDRKCEWCLDPTPSDATISPLGRHQGLEQLPPLADHFPVALEPRKPLEGWVRLNISEIDPDKLDGVTDYHLTIKSSIGVEYPLTKVTKRPGRGDITTRTIGEDGE